MVIFGGINDFNHQLNDTIIYDLKNEKWLDDVPIKGCEMPFLSHSKGYAAFYG